MFFYHESINLSYGAACQWRKAVCCVSRAWASLSIGSTAEIPMSHNSGAYNYNQKY